MTMPPPTLLLTSGYQFNPRRARASKRQGDGQVIAAHAAGVLAQMQRNVRCVAMPSGASSERNQSSSRRATLEADKVRISRNRLAECRYPCDGAAASASLISPSENNLP